MRKLKKAKLIFCHSYKVNRFEKQVENWFIDRLTIIGEPFGCLKKN